MSKSPVLFAWVAAFSVAGCCGPCASWVTSSVVGSGAPSGPPAVPGAPPPAAVSQGAEGPQSPGSGPAARAHPVFPVRRGYRTPWVSLTSKGAWIPQLPEAGQAFESMPKNNAPGPTDGLVICHLEVTGTFDDFRGPDVAVWFTAGGRQFDFWGPEDRRDSHFSIPHTTWKAGETLRLVAADRDVTGTEAIGTVEVAATGTVPVAFTHAQMNAECRAWPAGVVETKASAIAKKLSEGVASAQKSVRPRPATPEWGYDMSGVGALWDSLDALSAHVGLEDARVKGFAADLGKLEQDWTAAATGSVAAETVKLPALSKRTKLRLTDVDVTVDAVICDAAEKRALSGDSKWAQLLDPEREPPCFLRLSVKRTAPAESLFLFPGSYVSARFVMADGSEVDASQVNVLDAHGKVPTDFQWSPGAGETYSVILAPYNAAAIGAANGTRPVTRLLRFTRALPNGTYAVARLDG